MCISTYDQLWECNALGCYFVSGIPLLHHTITDFSLDAVCVVTEQTTNKTNNKLCDTCLLVGGHFIKVRRRNEIRNSAGIVVWEVVDVGDHGGSALVGRRIVNGIYNYFEGRRQREHSTQG